MISTTDIRNKIIDQLMAIKDAEFLRALSHRYRNLASRVSTGKTLT